MANILIIEDNYQTARMVTRLLHRAGHEVLSTQTGEEGLMKIMDALPDLVLVDLGLPDIDGQTIIGIIRQQAELANTAIIAFTAWSESTAREMAKAYGCDGVITKPIDTQTFPSQIEVFLNQSVGARKENGPQPEI